MAFSGLSNKQETIRAEGRGRPKDRPHLTQPAGRPASIDTDLPGSTGLVMPRSTRNPSRKRKPADPNPSPPFGLTAECLAAWLPCCLSLDVLQNRHAARRRDPQQHGLQQLIKL